MHLSGANTLQPDHCGGRCKLHCHQAPCRPIYPSNGTLVSGSWQFWHFISSWRSIALFQDELQSSDQRLLHKVETHSGLARP